MISMIGASGNFRAHAPLTISKFSPSCNQLNNSSAGQLDSSKNGKALPAAKQIPAAAAAAPPASKASTNFTSQQANKKLAGGAAAANDNATGNQNPSQQATRLQQRSNQSHNTTGLDGYNKKQTSTPTSAGCDTGQPFCVTKIDSDLVNVANENRVILNVGGIRHETYKVSFDQISAIRIT